MNIHNRRRQRGAASIEFALMLMLGLLPLLLFTFSGVMIMAAQQTLATASAEGARASLRYGSANERRTAACVAARSSMQWLLNFSGQPVDCSNGGNNAILVSAQAPCAGLASAQCMTVTVSYDYASHPFLPGTATLYKLVMRAPIRSVAVAQLDLGSGN
ncbi:MULTISPECIES: TadE/TadG family type IV pilus assembly protein [Stenotrophomonas]|uniref:TadE/TadG family type IV pilus assembly protein n=1 Tax=Stenotrophomonas TaxID=40323 RepID=UPI00122FDB7A|nr:MULTISPECIES: TadE/TadG family type IV pilus assembly protein [Stenotrophomonas]MBH1818256.1 pilus assembly protein [Stenotrophomonas maltophilia]MCU1031621.1 pilus assembly protein [Stenotrophomonas maltophilia]